MTGDNPETIVGLFGARVAELGEGTALLERSGERWVSYGWKEWNDRSRAVAASLIAEGVKPGENVAIYSYSRREWVEADIAILMARGCTVTVYQNLVPDSVRYILEDSGASVIFAEGPVQLQTLFGGESGLPDTVRRVITFLDRQAPLTKPGKPPKPEISLEEAVPADKRDLVVKYDDFLSAGQAKLEERGAELDARIAAIEPGDVAKVVYTSGTTGQPKGAMLTHGNLVAVVGNVEHDLSIRAGELCLLFLPLAHVYAQLTYHAALSVGFQIAFARSMLTAVDDAESVRPHFFTSVPRLFEKIHAGLLSKIEQASPLKQKIFRWSTGVGAQVSEIRQQGGEPGGMLAFKEKIATKLVFSKLKNRLGGRIRFAVSGGAPLQKHLLEFFHAAGLLIIEGYGMTENASLSHCNRAYKFKFGTVGKAIDNSEVVIAEDGEILVRGPGVMKGYLGQPEATAEAIDSDGFLHSGDIGVVDEDGYLTITDRKKDLIVTSGGKNIAPAPIEAALTRIRFVSQAVVFGDGRKFLVALLTLDPEYAQQWAAEQGIEARGEALAGDERLKSAVDAEVVAVNSRLDSWSTIKKVAILGQEFSMDKGEVTPSLKLRRRVIEEHYLDVIDGMYPVESPKA
jgi:long-chain acyl-CoA synthetase